MAQEEPLYCAQQIKIPPQLPEILKQFTKAAIKTQPADVLEWSQRYFVALSKGEALPSGEVQAPPVADAKKPDVAILKSFKTELSKQSNNAGVITLALVEKIASTIHFPGNVVTDVFLLGGFDSTGFPWKHFFALSCTMSAGDLQSTMELVCKILSERADNAISFGEFQEIYSYLVSIDSEIPKEQVNNVYGYLRDIADKNEGFVKPADFSREECPPLS
eukprot:Colp12_sorted_trinity150504_noHs@5347